MVEQLRSRSIYNARRSTKRMTIVSSSAEFLLIVVFFLGSICIHADKSEDGYLAKFPRRPTLDALGDRLFSTVTLPGTYHSTFSPTELEGERYHEVSVAAQLEQGIRFFEVPAYNIDGTWYTLSSKKQASKMKGSLQLLDIDKVLLQPIASYIKSEKTHDLFVINITSVRCESGGRGAEFTINENCTNTLGSLFTKRLGSYMLPSSTFTKYGDQPVDLPSAHEDWSGFSKAFRSLGKTLFAAPIRESTIGETVAYVHVFLPYSELSVEWMSATSRLFFPAPTVLYVYRTINKQRNACIKVDKAYDSPVKEIQYTSSFEYCLELCRSTFQCVSISFKKENGTCVLSTKRAQLLNTANTIAVELKCYDDNSQNSAIASARDIRLNLQKDLCLLHESVCEPFRETEEEKNALLKSVHFYSTNASVSMKDEFKPFMKWLEQYYTKDLPDGIVNFFVTTHTGEWPNAARDIFENLNSGYDYDSYYKRTKNYVEEKKKETVEMSENNPVVIIPEPEKKTINQVIEEKPIIKIPKKKKKKNLRKNERNLPKKGVFWRFFYTTMALGCLIYILYKYGAVQYIASYFQQYSAGSNHLITSESSKNIELQKTEYSVMPDASNLPRQVPKKSAVYLPQSAQAPRYKAPSIGAPNELYKDSDGSSDDESPKDNDAKLNKLLLI